MCLMLIINAIFYSQIVVFHIMRQSFFIFFAPLFSPHALLFSPLPFLSVLFSVPSVYCTNTTTACQPTVAHIQCLPCVVLLSPSLFGYGCRR